MLHMSEQVNGGSMGLAEEPSMGFVRVFMGLRSGACHSAEGSTKEIAKEVANLGFSCLVDRG